MDRFINNISVYDVLVSVLCFSFFFRFLSFNFLSLVYRKPACDQVMHRTYIYSH